MANTIESPFEQLVVTIMLEFIISDPALVLRYRQLFKQRVDSYLSNELELTTYLTHIHALAEEKLQ